MLNRKSLTLAIIIHILNLMFYTTQVSLKVCTHCIYGCTVAGIPLDVLHCSWYSSVALWVLALVPYTKVRPQEMMQRSLRVCVPFQEGQKQYNTGKCGLCLAL